MTDLVRQSVYSRLAGYEDVNDAERLSQNPAFRLIGSSKIWERGAALTSRLQSFETELLAQPEGRADGPDKRRMPSAVVDKLVDRMWWLIEFQFAPPRDKLLSLVRPGKLYNLPAESVFPKRAFSSPLQARDG